VRPLSAAELLGAWEAGEDQHPLDRALTLLGAADPAASRGELARLPLGERDARLLRLRARTVGRPLAGYTECPACGERLEFTLGAEELLPAEEPGPGPWDAAAGEVALRFRLPDSRDLAAAAGCRSVAEARRLLATRCVLEARAGDRPVDPAALAEDAVEALAARMAEVAPDTERTLALACPACGTAWEAALDVPAFFWAEVAVRARRLMHEVDALARAYHWSEPEILAMSPRRRRAYLEMAEA
jgi:uncharacterized protein (UPF0212 family)